MQSSESLANLSPALVLALGEIEGAAKSAVNPHFRSKYANLETVVDASRPILAKHGLAAMQGAGRMTERGCLTVTTRIIHTSGEWIESDFEIPLAKQDPQAALAALTYARRGSLMSILGMPAVDDDGESAMGRGTAAPAANAPTQPEDRNGAGPCPEGPDWWGCSGSGMTAHAAKKDGWDIKHEDMRSQIGALSSGAEWRKWCADNSEDIAKMPKAWRVILREEAEHMAKELGVYFNSRKAALPWLIPRNLDCSPC
jgi:hypothetical protein